MHLRHRLPALLAGVAAAALAAPGFTAETTIVAAATADQSNVDELVVVGRREGRDEAVQRVPVAITSLSGLKLEQQGITSIRELGNIAPNLFQSRVAVSYLNTQLFIRGVGEPDAQGEPSVAVTVDGVYQPKNVGLQQELLDIDRIEVQRGPQGQDGGHAGPAGTLAITTVTPGNTPQFRVQASYGNYNDARLGVLASGPLGGKWYGSIAAGYHRRDGFSDNTTLDREVNNVNYLSGRGKLRYVANDALEFQLTIGGIHDRSTTRGVQDLLTNDFTSRNQLYPYNRFDQLSAAFNADRRIDDHLRLTWMASAYGFYQNALFDNTGDFYGRNSQIVVYKDRAYQTELKLAGDYGNFSFETGLFGYREEWFTNRRANTPVNATNDPALIRYRPICTLIQQNSDIVAGYAQGSLALGPRLKLTAGSRLQWERRTNDNQLYNLVATAPFRSNTSNFQTVLNGPVQALVWSTSAQKDWTTLQPKASIEYSLNDDTRFYGTIGRGDKSAGFDYRAQTPTPTGYLQATVPFNPEKVTNYEIGFKFTTPDTRFRFNAAAFYIQFDDIQITTNDPVTTITRRYNAGKGSTRGLEAEATILPTDGLQFDLSASYLDARLDEFYGVATRATFPNGLVLNTSPFAGAVLPNAPRYQARVAGTWRLPVGGPGLWSLQGDVSFQSKSYTDTNNNAFAQLPDQTYANAQLRWASTGDRWTAILSVRNIGDVRYALPPGYAPASNGTPLYRTTNYNDPRTVLLTVGWRL